MSVAIIIPARYQSSRFPGKPLAMLSSKSLIQRSWEAAQAVDGADAVYVATDDDRIAEHAETFGAKVLMTPPECRNGTERVFAAAKQLPEMPDVLVNLQGDAPLTPPHFVEALIAEMQAHPDVQMATPALQCSAQTLSSFLEDRRAGRVGGTTVVFDANHNALYFSKEVLPYGADAAQVETLPVFHHVGLYAYRYSLLERYATWPEGMLERREGLEQLRVLEHGHPIRMVVVDAHGKEFWEVNNPEDIARVEGLL